MHVIVVGAGFTGTLLASALQQSGLQVTLIDANPPPRFAIGESSTPIADLLLERICQRFGWDSLKPLARYGNWQRAYPAMHCGPKRGFSYFAHHAHQAFRDDIQHSNSMLVAASANLEVADTHWLRADVDSKFFAHALELGVQFVCGSVIDVTRSTSQVVVTVTTERAAPQAIAGDFLVDASGTGGSLHDLLGIANCRDQLKTVSHSTFGHVHGLDSWDDHLLKRGFDLSDHPFPSDQAAQHHLLSNGWLWMLRFDHGVTSVGWTRPGSSTPQQLAGLPARAALGLDVYPDLRDLFAKTEFVGPAGGWTQTGRLQRLASRVVGDRFALMPTSAVTIDPLHSAGIAHGLSGVWRLTEILTAPANARAELFAEYQRQVLVEAQAMDCFVAGCYAAGNQLGLFEGHAAFYFLAAIHTEERIATEVPWSPLWLADDQAFRVLAEESYQRLSQLRQQGDCTSCEVNAYREWVKEVIRPWNHVGLLNTEPTRMYHYTAAPK